MSIAKTDSGRRCFLWAENGGPSAGSLAAIYPPSLRVKIIASSGSWTSVVAQDYTLKGMIDA